jgi:hypothetical protein
MAVDFTLTPEQKLIQLGARDFAQTVLAPIVQAVDQEPDPLRGFQMMKPAYRLFPASPPTEWFAPCACWIGLIDSLTGCVPSLKARAP